MDDGQEETNNKNNLPGTIKMRLPRQKISVTSSCSDNLERYRSEVSVSKRNNAPIVLKPRLVNF